MRAVQLVEVGQDPQIRKVTVPEPRPGEVRVAMRACGICGSDVHVVDGTIATAGLPMTLGHEASGVVEALGPGVDDLAIGARVLINPIVTCGHCPACDVGRENLCPDNQVLGVDLPGAHAELVLAPRRNLVELPDSIDFPTAAILADAVAGPYRAIKRAGLRRGDTAVVFGLGGLGLHAALLLDQVFGVRVVGVDTDDLALDRAASFGVDRVFDGRDPRVSASIRHDVGPVDAALEFVGQPAVIEQALRSLRPGGSVIVMGLSQKSLELGLREDLFVAKELQLFGAYGYAADDLRELVEMVGRGDLRIKGTITHMFDLADYQQGLDTLRTRRGGPIRVVITHGD